MIDKLRKRMIWISGCSLIAVFLVIFVLICALSTRQLNRNMDMLTDRISEGGGFFLPFDKNNPRPPGMDRFPNFFTEETPFSTRFFAVHFSHNGEIVGENIDSVSSVTREEAQIYARETLAHKHTRGWKENYRYKVFETPIGQSVVFVDGSMNRATTQTLLLTSGCVLIGSMVVILFLIILLSKRAVRPMAESYEKQKQFVTDANHELKTPLTLILTNLEILEAETGKNEWLDDIRTEGQRMAALVSQLTALSRLDEDRPQLQKEPFSLTDMVRDTACEFSSLAASRGLAFYADISPWLSYLGDEGTLRQLTAILLDNAVKYCDPGGSILLSLSQKRHPILCVENACRNVDALELNRLFDRFYRADQARTAGSSFGVGLSLARSIAEQHHGEIKAYKAGPGRIGFRVILR